MVSSAQDLHQMFAAQAGQIRWLELQLQQSQVDSESLQQMHGDISQLCARLESELDELDAQEVPAAENKVTAAAEGTEAVPGEGEGEQTESTAQSSAGSEVAELAEQRVTVWNEPLLAMKNSQLLAQQNGTSGGLTGLLDGYNFAIMMIESRDGCRISQLHANIGGMKASVGAMLSSAVSDQLMGRVAQIRTELDGKVDVHEVARVNQDIAKCTDDYNQFSGILENTADAVGFLDNKVKDNLAQIWHHLQSMDPNNVSTQVQAPLMLVNSLVPNSGGHVGGYSVSVTRTAMHGPATHTPQQAVSMWEASAGLA